MSDHMIELIAISILTLLSSSILGPIFQDVINRKLSLLKSKNEVVIQRRIDTYISTVLKIRNLVEAIETHILEINNAIHTIELEELHRFNAERLSVQFDTLCKSIEETYSTSAINILVLSNRYKYILNLSFILIIRIRIIYYEIYNKPNEPKLLIEELAKRESIVKSIHDYLDMLSFWQVHATQCWLENRKEPELPERSIPGIKADFRNYLLTNEMNIGYTLGLEHEHGPSSDPNSAAPAERS
jgi:hypothetical protein